MSDTLTDADLVVLGLLAEEPRHAYDLDAVIGERGIREWTTLAFSSLYYVLNRLEKRGLVRSERAEGGPKARRVYTPTDDGFRACVHGTLRLISEVPPHHVPLLIGIANSPLLSEAQLEHALVERQRFVRAKLAELRGKRREIGAANQVADAIFAYYESTFGAEVAWISHLLTAIPLHVDGSREG